MTRAVERQFVTQQTMSGTLAKLRAHCGDEPLVRIGRRLELTPLGRSLVDPVREALLHAEAALATQPFFDPSSARRVIVPVLAETAGHYGNSPEEIGRASPLGQPMHTLSPLVAAVYLKCALLGIALDDLQRYAWKYCLALCFVLIAAALLYGVVPFAR